MVTYGSPTRPTILLQSGEYFDFTKPEESAFRISDIAHALGNLCRFNGHVTEFYSVAEHSYHCSFLVPKEHAMAALLHDAAEAYLGDVSRPLKHLLPEYKVIEERVEVALAAYFGLQYPWSEEVKAADTLMLRHEQHTLRKNRDQWHGVPDAAPLDRDLVCWAPYRARGYFVERYLSLGGVL